MNNIFSSNFFIKFQAINVDDLINLIDRYDETNIDNSKFKWGKMCSSNKIALKQEDTIDLIAPNINHFADILESHFNYNLFNPWINLYKRGDHQEVHSHHPCDMSCVFFANHGKGFSKFYFRDRNNTNIHPKLANIIGYDQEIVIKYKKGDIMFFPSHILHGVSPHNSDIVRKSLSFNFDVK